MRIAYLVHLNLGPQSGVFQKVLKQARVWANAGHQVGLFVVTRNAEVREALGHAGLKHGGTVCCYRHGLTIRSFIARLAAFKQVAKDVLAWEPDIVYTRQDLYYSPVRTVARLCRLVVEVNTNDLAEIRMHSTLQWLYHYLTRGLVLRSATGLVYPCQELAKLGHYRKFGKPYQIIGNGVALDEIQTAPPPKGSQLRLVFVGQARCPWHGLDKVVLLAKSFPEWRFDLIGVGLPDLGGQVPVNVVFHGPLGRSEYQEFLSAADCAIGTLALHREALNEASPLKTRECLAYGLPVIIGYRDTDLAADSPFVLELPNTETNVSDNLTLIQSFVEKWKGQRVPREAVLHLDYKVKEATRLHFFQTLSQRQEAPIDEQ